MAEEDKRGDLGLEGSEKDQFPVGMRVLAVDDDPVCLKFLDNLLRRCHYNVTTTDQAIIALNLLRENKDKYDLIISDVNMPDMDGFKLLELVGLEMDLPVIMLSAYSDTELVRKGIMHGACDYLLKPVRIEEIKNIWQHVLRRRKPDSNDQNKSLSEEKNNDGSVGNGQEAALTGNANQNGKRNTKRKVNKDEDNKEESEESGDENEDPATRKKARLQWTSELHAKFFAAVNQLGYDKAVPKKILELMNVESLTRANVASHLQKFRHYLQKVSNDVQQPNTSFRSKDSSYLSKGSLDGFGDYSSLPAKGRFSDTVLSPHPGSILDRLNSSANLSSHGMTSYGLIQPIQSLSNFNTPGKLHSLVLPANQSTNLFQGIPGFSEHSESRSKYANHTGDFHRNIGLTAFTVSSGFTDAGVTVGGPRNIVAINSNNPLIPQAYSSQSQSSVAFGTQFPGRVHTSGFSSSQDSFLNKNLTGILSSTSTCIANDSFSFPSSSALKAATLGNSTGDLQCHSRLNVNAIDNNHNQSNTFDAINTLASANVGLASLSNSMEQSHTEAEKYGLDKMEQTQPQDGLQKSNYYSLDDVTNSMLKQDPNDIMSMMDEDFSFDPYSLGSFL